MGNGSFRWTILVAAAYAVTGCGTLAAERDPAGERAEAALVREAAVGDVFRLERSFNLGDWVEQRYEALDERPDQEPSGLEKLLTLVHEEERERLLEEMKRHTVHIRDYVVVKEGAPSLLQTGVGVFWQGFLAESE